MFSALSLLTALLLAISIAASPVQVRTPRITLPFAKRVNTNETATNVVQHDQARLAALKKLGGRASAIEGNNFQSRDRPLPSTGNVTNHIVAYTASIGIGTPPTYYNLIVDTGTSNMWIGADQPYIQTSTSVDTGDEVSVSYGSQSFSGKEWVDGITIGTSFYAPYHSFGVASSTDGFPAGVDGVLGLGPLGLTAGTVTGRPTVEIPTLTNSVYVEALDAQAVVSIFFAPPTSDNDMNGGISFGGVDPTKFNGDVFNVSITETSPASQFWGIDLSITYGDKMILSQTAGIVDTGSTLVLIASDAYDAYKQATDATEDQATNLLKLTASQYNNLQNLNFNMYTQTFSLIPNAQIWPRSLNSYIGGSNDAIYSIVSSTGTPSGQGLDFSLGQVFVERFYCVFDTGGWQVGFATTNYTNATTN